MTWRPDLHPRNADGEFRRRDGAARIFERDGRRLIDMDGTVLRVSDRAPEAMRRGFRRAGDHPQLEGSIDGRGNLLTPSTHPMAGGLWIDPDRPGTRHAPRYVNDAGMPVAGLRPAPHRSERRKSDLQARRREGMYGSPDTLDLRELRRGDEVIGERLGYQGSPEMRTFLKRAQARTRLETGRQPVRRTPRGTQMDSWMNSVNARMPRGEGR